MPELMDEGRFRGDIVDYSLFESSKSDSVGVKIVVALKEIFQDGQWQDISEHSFTTSGLMNVVKRDGQINQRQVECLIEYAGWSGRFEHIVNREWQPKPVGVTVGRDTYNGEVSYRISWVNSYDDGGVSSSGADSEVASALDSRFGSLLRGMAANVQRSQTTPTGKPQKFVSKVEEDIPF